MGMDVYGLEPANAFGKYFRNTVWSWRPLWDFVGESCDLTLEVKRSGHFNDGLQIDKFTARRIAKTLFSLLQDGAVATYQKNQEELLKALPDDECTHCNGTGVRDDEYVQGECNGCGGAGKVRPFETHYLFSIENVRKFAHFCDKSGGFEIY
mgnify:FL=1